MHNMAAQQWLVQAISFAISFERHEQDAENVVERRFTSWVEFYNNIIEKPIQVPQRSFTLVGQTKRKITPRRLRGYSLTHYASSHRSKRNVKETYGVALDFDKSNMKPDELHSALDKLGYCCMYHTTLSHGAGGTCSYRVIFPLETACQDIKAWERTQKYLVEKVKIEIGLEADDAAKDPSRFWYWPAVAEGETYSKGAIDGKLLPVQPKVHPVGKKELTPNGGEFATDSGGVQPRRGGSSQEDSAHLWLMRQLQEYPSLPQGARGNWLAARIYFLGGMFAGGGINMPESEVIGTIHRVVMSNSSRSEAQEMSFVRRQFESGKDVPITPRQQARRISSTPVIPPAPPPSPESTTDWQQQLIRGDTGFPKKMQHNVCLIVDNHHDLAGLFKRDLMALKTIVTRSLDGEVDEYPREITDGDYREVQAWIERKYLFSPSVEHVVHAVQAQGLRNATHPVRDYLNRLERKSKEDILSGWMTRYLGVKDCEYTRAVARKSLISAVARIYEPGCKVDTMPILEGVQGAKKSTVISTLFCGSKWFADSIKDISSKDAILGMTGKWGIEMAELHAWKRAQVDEIKGFLSCRVDRMRLPYARESIDIPRQCVFWGSTNRDFYQTDETGSRRYWAVKCSDDIDVHGLEKARDELWAQAVEAYKLKEPWWMHTKELEDLAEAEQDDRFEADIWEERVLGLLLNKEEVTIPELLKGLDIHPQHWGRKEQLRISMILKRNKWHAKQVRDKGIRIYRWFRPS